MRGVLQGVSNHSGVVLVPRSHIALRRSFTIHRTVPLRRQFSHQKLNLFLGEQRLSKNNERELFADLVLRCQISRDSSTSTRSLVEPFVKFAAELECNVLTEDRGSIPNTANAPARRRGKRTSSRASRWQVETADQSAFDAPSPESNARGLSDPPGKGRRRVSTEETKLPAEPKLAASDKCRDSGGSASLSLAIVKYNTSDSIDPQKSRRSFQKLSKKTQKRLHTETLVTVESKRKTKRMVGKLSKKERRLIYKMERKKVLKKKKAQKQAREQNAASSDVRPPKLIPLAVTLGTGLLLWCCPTPNGISEEGWNLVAIFAATTVGFVSQPMPLGGVALVGLLVSVVTGTLPFSQAFAGFAGTTPWVTLSAFLFAKGINISGIGKRAAFILVSRFGNTILGLSYSLVIGELLLSVAIPSKSARAGGVFGPIIAAVAEGDACDERPLKNKLGTFLSATQFQGGSATAALLLTGTPFNVLCCDLARDTVGADITWGSWFAASSLPVLTLVAIMPAMMHILVRPADSGVTTATPSLGRGALATSIARDKLEKMGRPGRREQLTLGILVITVALWSVGESLFGMNNATAGLCGVSLLLLSGVLTWDECLEETAAWDCFLWFAAMIALSSGLDQLGVMAMFSDYASGLALNMALTDGPALAFLSIIYIYSHYFFASNTAHISAMFPALLLVAVSSGTSPLEATLALAISNHIMSGLTHYSSGNAPVYFKLGYCSIEQWWGYGFAMSLIQIAVWLTVGRAWWSFLGILDS